MKNFTSISKDEVIPRLMEGEEVYAFYFTIYKNGNVVPVAKRLSPETLSSLHKIVNDPNIVFYVKKEGRV